MSTFRLVELILDDFRCFANLDVTFDSETTVFFAENGGGKTAVLMGVAMTLGLLQRGVPKDLVLNVDRDGRKVRTGDRREFQGTCAVQCEAQFAGKRVVWGSIALPRSSGRRNDVREAVEAIERIRKPNERWPLVVFYGTNRLARARKPGRKKQQFQDRWDGYHDSLDPETTDGPLLDWLKAEALGDLVRHRKGEPERRLERGVFEALRRGTPGVKEAFYDPALESPVIRFDDGREATWSELSDGYHMFFGLVGDIARRAVILNHMDGAEAPLLVEGVALIDEVDLHLHPNWQRTVLHGLRAAFPKLQFIVTTHSPQVVSSAKNEQVRWLRDGKLAEGTVHVEGRDTNSILREYMATDDRGDEGAEPLRELYALIDDGKVDDARARLTALRKRWGSLDKELIRAEGLVDEAAGDPE
jgi:predicted ATP-binding protein involved in virulence